MNFCDCVDLMLIALLASIVGVGIACSAAVLQVNVSPDK
jgi:uncharacterized membrane protein